MAKCCSERLDTFRKWLGVATLRSLRIDAVPEELQAESLHSRLTFVRLFMVAKRVARPDNPRPVSLAVPC